MFDQLSNLGWVDLDLECSTILPSCSAVSAEIPSAQAESARQWNCQNQGQPNPTIRPDAPPCICLILYDSRLCIIKRGAWRRISIQKYVTIFLESQERQTCNSRVLHEIASSRLKLGDIKGHVTVSLVRTLSSREDTHFWIFFQRNASLSVITHNKFSQEGT